MKMPVVILLACSAAVFADPVELSDSYRRIEAEQVALWTSKLAEAEGKPPKVQLETLWLGLRNMGYRRTIEGHSPAVDEVFARVQKTMLSIPGHAEHFVNKLFDAYGKSKDPFLDPSCHNLLTLTCDTLAQMPSEETVRMAGRMLEYTGDVPSPQRLAELREKLRTPGSVTGMRMSLYAAGLFARLPIENSPQRFRGLDGPIGDESLWKQWWQEVKDGKRRYRFEGSEEWLPRDSAAPPPGMKRPPKDGRLPDGAGAVKNAPPSGQAGADRPDPAVAGTLVWPWVAGIVVVTGLGLWWLRRRGAS